MTITSYWHTLHDDTLPWIKIVFAHEYNLRKLKILQTEQANYRFKDVIIEFSEGSRYNYTLKNGNDWISLELPDVTRSQYVKITRKSGWGPLGLGYTGISKILAFGYRTGNFYYGMIIRTKSLTINF